MFFGLTMKAQEFFAMTDNPDEETASAPGENGAIIFTMDYAMKNNLLELSFLGGESCDVQKINNTGGSNQSSIYEGSYEGRIILVVNVIPSDKDQYFLYAICSANDKATLQTLYNKANELVK